MRFSLFLAPKNAFYSVSLISYRRTKENGLEWLKMCFCFFKLKIPKKMCSYSIKSVLLRKVSLKQNDYEQGN